MGNADRNSATDLGVETVSSISLPSDVRSYNFFQLVELLHRQREITPDSDDWEKPAS